MKEFEKEWKKTLLSDKYKPIAKAYYRVALEWTLKTAKELEEQDAPIFMEDVIKQELEQD